MKAHNTEIYDGMEVYKIEEIDYKFRDTDTEILFRTTKNGLVLKAYDSNTFITLNDDTFITELNYRTLNKLKKINPNLDYSNFKIELMDDKHNKTFNTIMKNARIPASNVSLKITANKDIFNIIYNVGLGNSTGCGYGHIYPISLRNHYKGFELANY